MCFQILCELFLAYVRWCFTITYAIYTILFIIWYCAVSVDSLECRYLVQTVISCVSKVVKMEATGLTQEMQNLHLQERVIENNVIFYLQTNHKSSTDDQIRSECKGNFSEDEIISAKQLLANEYYEVLSAWDKELGQALVTRRNNKKGNSDRKLDTIIIDILDAIDGIEACDEKITIIAKDELKIPKHKSR